MHWYNFLVDSHNVICKANRKSEVLAALPEWVNPRFTGCVAHERVSSFKGRSDYTIFGSVDQMKSVLMAVS